jgi:hypothetical protein
MPWPSGKDFAQKHNKKLLKSPAKAQKAADIATGALKRGVPEGEAIAIGNAYVKKHSAAKPKTSWQKAAASRTGTKKR